ncbi:MAG: proteasome subunit beta [Promethearchaeota archaeon]|jgi:proteasome beta subunit
MRNEEKLNSTNFEFQKNFGFELRDNAKFKDNKLIKNLKTGTTTVGITCKEAVILGTDKRASMGYFVASKTSEKLYRIQDHLYITTAGGVADNQYLVDVLRAETTIFQFAHEGKPILVKSAGKLLSNILYANKMFPYEVGLILGGVTESEGPTLLDIGAYGSILKEKFCSVGSGQNFSYGVLEAKYKDNLSIEEGKEIVKKAVTSSIIRDMASGNGIDIAVIKKDGAEREFIPI